MIRSLDAARVEYPSANEIVRVVEGTVFVFGVDEFGVRYPLTTIGVGEVLVGCSATDDGDRLMITGTPSSRITVSPLDGETDVDALDAWAICLGTSIADNRWPARVVDASDLVGVLAPGENLIGERTGRPLQDSRVSWVSITSGAATVCGVRHATVGPMDAPIPLGPQAWLTAGLRCWAKVVEPPATPPQWTASLDLLGRNALVAARQRQSERDRAQAERFVPRQEQSVQALHQSIAVLVGSVLRAEDRIPARIPDLSNELAATSIVARESGLTVDGDALDRAVADFKAGRPLAEAAAASFGGVSRRVSLRQGWHRRGGRPMVAWITAETRPRRRPVALIPGRRWSIIEPTTGERSPVDRATAGAIEPHAYELLPVLPARPTSLGELRSIASSAGRRDACWVAAMTVAVAFAAFVMPLLLGHVAQLLIHSNGLTAYLSTFAALILTIAAGTLWAAVRSFGILRLRARSVGVAAGALWDRMMRQPAQWHADRTFGDRMAQATAATEASNTVPDESIISVLDACIIVGSLGAVGATAWQLALGIGASLLAAGLTLAWMLKRAARHTEERVAASAAAQGRLEELLRGVNRIRLAGAESRAFLGWARLQARFARADHAVRQVWFAQSLLLALWPTFTIAVVVGITATAGLSFTAVVTAQTAIAAIAIALAGATAGADGLVVAQRTLAVARPLLEATPEGGNGTISPGPLQGGLAVRNIVFRYGPSLRTVLDHVDMTVRPGEHIAIVGPSGCGKTTLMRVLLGLADPESGVITFDGLDLTSLDRPAVRRQIGAVLQSSQLLPSSIRRNVDMGRGLPSHAVWSALDSVGMGDDVRAMPMGLETQVSDGVGSISGGQRQRILIARALAGTPRILVLDEATSALDNVTQAAVVASLERLRITRVVVAHRLSTVRHADRIIVMTDGRVVDEGTFDELIGRPGIFRDMAQRQQA